MRWSLATALCVVHSLQFMEDGRDVRRAEPHRSINVEGARPQLYAIRPHVHGRFKPRSADAAVLACALRLDDDGVVLHRDHLEGLVAADRVKRLPFKALDALLGGAHDDALPHSCFALCVLFTSPT